MATHRFTVDIKAPIEFVSDIWTSPERWHEWIGGGELNEFVRIAEREAQAPATQP